MNTVKSIPHKIYLIMLGKFAITVTLLFGKLWAIECSGESVSMWPQWQISQWNESEHIIKKLYLNIQQHRRYWNRKQFNLMLVLKLIFGFSYSVKSWYRFQVINTSNLPLMLAIARSCSRIFLPTLPVPIVRELDNI